MLIKTRLIYLIIIIVSFSGCTCSESTKNQKPPFIMHSLAIGTGYDEAEDILSKGGFVKIENVGKNYTNYKLDGNMDKAQLGILYDSKDSEGKIYSIRFSTNAYKFSSMANIEKELTEYFGEGLFFNHKKENSIEATSVKKSKHGPISLFLKANLKATTYPLFGLVKIDHTAKPLASAKNRGG